MKIPNYYLNDHWIKSIGTKPLGKRLQERIEDLKKKVDNIPLKERQEMWLCEPYWEISEIIINSKDWVFPKTSGKEKK